MEIKKLRSFRTVVEAGGLSRAAELLHVTPGALSKMVTQLEAELGQALFRRRGRGLVLTDLGKLLYGLSERLVEEHARVLERLDASRPVSSATIRIASFEVFTTHCLGALTERLGEHGLHVLEQKVGDIEAAVLGHEADIGITYLPAPSRELNFERACRIEFGIFVRRGAFRDTRFDELPFAIPTAPVRHLAGSILGVDCWPYESVPRLVKYRLTSLESALELTRRGRCAVFIPQFLAGLHNETVRAERKLVRFSNPPRMRRCGKP